MEACSAETCFAEAYLAEACSVWRHDIEQLIAGDEFRWTAEACFVRRHSLRGSVLLLRHVLSRHILSGSLFRAEASFVEAYLERRRVYSGGIIRGGKSWAEACFECRWCCKRRHHLWRYNLWRHMLSGGVSRAQPVF